MNATFVDDADGKGTPGVIRHDHVGLGLAVDVEKAGGRTLLVPVHRRGRHPRLRGFVAAYEDLVRKIHNNKIAPDDFAGTTVTLTNPGTIGTVQSVPRLMPGQGVIVGVGALGVPAGFEAADPRMLAELGVGKTVTVTSTYDHRIIQGAESGLFLAHVSECLMGGHDFYRDVFDSLEIPYEPVTWQMDDNPSAEDADGGHERLVKQNHVQTLINMYRVRGHLIAHLDPLDAEPPELHSELDPLHYGLTIWDLPRLFVADGLAGKKLATLDEMLSILRDAYCRTMGVEYMHIQDPDQKRWIQQHVEGVSTAVGPDEQRHILDRLNAAEVFERFLHTRYVGQKRFGLEGAESAIVLLDAILDEAVKDGLHESVMGMAHRGRLNVLANIVGKSYGEIFEEFEGNLDPESRAGLGRRQVPQGRQGAVRGPRRRRASRRDLASNPSHLEAVDPVVVGMARARQDASGASGAAVRARRRAGRPVPRPARSWSTATPPSPARAWWPRRSTSRGCAGYRTGGTVHLVINNQLGFTHRHRGRPFLGVPDRRGQDGPGPDLPRERGRPRGLRPGGPARLRLPPGVPQGRRDRHGLLPPPRPQRGRRPELHPAAHVPLIEQPTLGPQALHRDAGPAGRHHARGGRAGPRRLLRPAAGRPRRDPGRGRAPHRAPPAACPRGRAARPVHPADRRPASTPSV